MIADLGAGTSPALYDLCSKYRSGVLVCYTKKPWREMPVTASYQSCFFDVFSQRKQKNHAPQKKGVIWVQGHAPALYDLYSKYRSGVLVCYTKKPWREMPVTASYQSCFFDVFSQRKQKNHAPQKKGVIWVQGHTPAGAANRA